jgi:hypothetical protein
MSEMIKGTRVLIVGKMVGTDEEVTSDVFFEDAVIKAPQVGERYYWGVWSDKSDRIVGVWGTVQESEPYEMPHEEVE